MPLELTDPRPIERAEEILTPEALDIRRVAARAFRGSSRRAARGSQWQAEGAASARTLDFLSETEGVRNGDWQVAPAPPALQDRGVEMTGPASPAKWRSTRSTPARRCGWPIWRTLAAPSWPNVIDAHPQPARCALWVRSPSSGTGKDYALRTDAPLAVVWPGPAAGTCLRHTLSSTASRASAPWSISVCTSFIWPSS